MGEKKEKILPPRKPVTPCRNVHSQIEQNKAGRTPLFYDAFPRDCRFAYMTPAYYATGFRILDVYKTKVDFTEMRSLLFLEDPNLVHKWGNLKSRIPYPESRVTDLPGTRDLNYHNYCLRSLVPESASSWRKSISRPEYEEYYDNKPEYEDEAECEENYEYENGVEFAEPVTE